MLLSILGIIDILLGGVLAGSPFFVYTASAIVAVLGIVALIKGAYSVLAGAATGFYMDILGWLDVVVGALLLITTIGISFQWFLWIGLFMAAKGLYSIAIEMIGD